MTNTIWRENMKKRKNINNTYLSEYFLIELGINFDFPNILKVLKRIDNEIANRINQSGISYQELRDLWDVLKDFSSILIDNKETLTYLYNIINIFFIDAQKKQHISYVLLLHYKYLY